MRHLLPELHLPRQAVTPTGHTSFIMFGEHSVNTTLPVDQSPAATTLTIQTTPATIPFAKMIPTTHTDTQK